MQEDNKEICCSSRHSSIFSHHGMQLADTELILAFLIHYNLHQDFILLCNQSIFREKIYSIHSESNAQQWFFLACYRLKMISSTHKR